MPQRRTKADKEKFWTLVNDEGLAPHAAGKRVGVNKNTVTAWLNKADDSSGKSWKQAKELGSLKGPIPYEELSPNALRGWNDFGFFRRYYFGRIASPWQEDAAWQMDHFLKNPSRDFVVLNCAPETGKTTLLHDVDAWITVRRRSLRGAILSRTDPKARSMCTALRRTFERTTPVQNEVDDVLSGRALDAESVLCRDYGRFQPEDRDYWRQELFVVAQHGGVQISGKEATWMSFGILGDYIGYRFDFVQADDVITERDLRNKETLNELFNTWDKVTERRLNQGGTLLLPMQRLGNYDLSNHCLEKLDGSDEGDNDDYENHANDDDPIENQFIIEPHGSRKGRLYHHIVYKAHDESRCEEVHEGPEVKPWPEGCLLEPERLPWKYINSIRKNNLQQYELIYQQREADPEKSLIQRMWIAGGVDQATGIEHYGCYDRDRGLLQVPKTMNGPTFSIMTVDPSVKAKWGLLWTLYEKRPDLRHLMNVDSKSMASNRFFDKENGKYVGLLEEWWQTSCDLKHPITDLVFEINAAQVFLTDTSALKEWSRDRKVRIWRHKTTSENKYKEGLGVQSIASHFEFGRWRIPLPNGAGHIIDLRRVGAYVDELCNYVFDIKQRDDQVMATWFFELKLPEIVRRGTSDPSQWQDDDAWSRYHRGRLRSVA